MKRHVRLMPSGGTGTGGQLPLVTLNVRSSSGTFVPLRFCIDTGADLTAIPIHLAEQAGISVPRSYLTGGTISGLLGTVSRYRGAIHLRIFGEDFAWPCAFLESPGPLGRVPYGVLGRAGFVSAFSTCIKDPFVTIERRRSELPAWQRVLLALVPSLSREHPSNEPL